jgi:3-hydroxybutyryl-CoA dehydrogenase
MINAPAGTVGVIGAGTMGQGIAQVCAAANFRVYLFDVVPDLIPAALLKISGALETLVERSKLSTAGKSEILSRITPANSLTDVRGDFIIEAVVEDLRVKQEIFASLEAVVSADAILLSNTSSIQISRISEALTNRQRFAGLHFFNPAPVMKLVEIVQGEQTSKPTVDKVREFALALGKQPVITQDSPGFIVNRVARLYYVEALRILEEGCAEPATIDKLMRSAGFRMGPFELMDLIGIDVNLSVTKSIYAAFDHASRFRPSEIQQQKVDAGLLGRKTGKGFYDYN